MHSTGLDSGNDLATDDMGNIYTTGIFSSTMDANPQAGINTLSSNGGYDFYIQKVFECKTSDSNFFQVACKSYTSPSGKYNWLVNGNYSDTIVNTKGCDSVLQITLFVTKPDTAIIKNDPTLSSNATNSTFQWLDCGNNYAIIPGETNTTYTATANGSYALEITENGCKDTSSCHQILTIGIEDPVIMQELYSIAPNPNTGQFTLMFTKPISATVEIRDILGKLIKSETTNQSSLLEFDLNTLSGIYFISVRTNSSIQETSKIIIK